MGILNLLDRLAAKRTLKINWEAASVIRGRLFYLILWRLKILLVNQPGIGSPFLFPVYSRAQKKISPSILPFRHPVVHLHKRPFRFSIILAFAFLEPDSLSFSLNLLPDRSISGEKREFSEFEFYLPVIGTFVVNIQNMFGIFLCRVDNDKNKIFSK